jgi:hypothetical protein
LFLKYINGSKYRFSQGRWDPAWINGDVVGTGEAGNGRDHSDNRGVNSLQIIAHLRAAAAADVGKEQKEKFAQAVESLKAAHGYGAEYGGRFFTSQ